MHCRSVTNVFLALMVHLLCEAQVFNQDLPVLALWRQTYETLRLHLLCQADA